MSKLICARTLTDAWMDDFEYLQLQGGEQLNLVTTISEPDPDLVESQIVEELDERLIRKGKQRVGTVANTIFPSAYLRGSATRQEFYERYLAQLPRLQKQRVNRQGTYFSRLIEYPATVDVRRGEKVNQLEGIIRKLQTQLCGRGPKRFAYQAQIFVPGRDYASLMGFPCLSFISFQLDQGHLCLTAIYRNQYYFERALGNFVGLSRLQQFVAQEVGLAQGSLTIHACHAEVDALNRRETQDLLRACRTFAPCAAAA